MPKFKNHSLSCGAGAFSFAEASASVAVSSGDRGGNGIVLRYKKDLSLQNVGFIWGFYNVVLYDHFTTIDSIDIVPLIFVNDKHARREASLLSNCVVL